MTLDMLVVWIVVGGVAGLLADALIKGIRCCAWPCVVCAGCEIERTP